MTVVMTAALVAESGRCACDGGAATDGWGLVDDKARLVARALRPDIGVKWTDPAGDFQDFDVFTPGAGDL